MPETDLISNMMTEIRRGTLSLAVLSRLKKPQYGYSLLQELEAKHVGIEANTLYPMLRRLEQQGLLKSDWDTTESRPRKYYALSAMGERVYAALKKAWIQLNEEMSALFEEESK